MRVYTLRFNSRVVCFCDDCQCWGPWGFAHKCSDEPKGPWFPSLAQLLEDQFGYRRDGVAS